MKTRENCKLKIKYFQSFNILYYVKKQVYKLKLWKKQKIYNVFYISLLKSDIIKKRWKDKIIL